MSAEQQGQLASFVGVVSDGKAGHLNQSIGLAEALIRLRPSLALREITASAASRALPAWLAGRAPGQAPEELSGLKLLIGAGHRTHFSLLALRRSACCPAIVLMRPSLPLSLFDLCIQPRHDGASEAARLWLSDGPLNRMQPMSNSAPHEDDTGLMLVGGPSPHNAWDSVALLAQIQRVCDGERLWELSGSRRTPPEFLTALRERDLPGLRVFSPDELPGDWLSQRLPRSSCCWVTPDSASMVYEALSAGCAVGLFDLLPAAGSRVAGSIEELASRGLVTSYSDFAAGHRLSAPREPFAEADRCARRIAGLGWV